MVCNLNTNQDSILLCDGKEGTCEREYHCACLSPPLNGVPLGPWFCPDCLNERRKEQEDEEQGSDFYASDCSDDDIFVCPARPSPPVFLPFSIGENKSFSDDTNSDTCIYNCASSPETNSPDTCNGTSSPVSDLTSRSVHFTEWAGEGDMENVCHDQSNEFSRLDCRVYDTQRLFPASAVISTQEAMHRGSGSESRSRKGGSKSRSRSRSKSRDRNKNRNRNRNRHKNRNRHRWTVQMELPCRYLLPRESLSEAHVENHSATGPIQAI